MFDTSEMAMKREYIGGDTKEDRKGKSIAQYAGLLHLKSIEEIPLAQTDI